MTWSNRKEVYQDYYRPDHPCDPADLTLIAATRDPAPLLMGEWLWVANQSHTAAVCSSGARRIYSTPIFPLESVRRYWNEPRAGEADLGSNISPQAI